MADEIHKFNRGDVAEGILGAALVAKFANRPKSLKDKNAPITVEMIDHVLDELREDSTLFEYPKFFPAPPMPDKRN